MNNILIIGPGAYGLCLCEVLQNNPNNVISLLGTCDERLKEIQNNEFVLFDTKIKPVKNTFTNYDECFKQVYNLIIFAVPSNKLAELLDAISPFINYDVNVINTSKGLMNENVYWCDFFQKKNKHFKYSFLAGPSFAQDVIKKQNTTCNLCTKSQNTFNQINEIFDCKYFKLVHLKPIKIYEFISSMKNAIALCFGIINATTESQNTINAAFVRILSDLKQILLKKFKTKSFELISYCGLGDILMCSTSHQSRNFSYGYDLIKLSKQELNKKYENLTVEGIRTLKILKQIISDCNIKTELIKYFIDYVVDDLITIKQLISYY